jgi:hypothetical protein
MTGDSARLGLALCASVFAHAWLFSAHPGGAAVRLPDLPVRVPIEARIAVTPRVMESAGRDAPGGRPIVPAWQEKPPEALLASPRRPAEADRRAASESANPARGAEKSISTPASRKLPAAIDATWYTAQDIDVYPRSGAPLLLEMPAGTAVARVLLWLRIDEHGAVVEVTAGEPGIPDAWVDAARAGFAAMRFAPARKDERAVRSRLLLSVSFAAAGTRD